MPLANHLTADSEFYLVQGVDFPHVDIVCSVGVPPSIVEALQRGGRGGRKTRCKGACPGSGRLSPMAPGQL